MIYIPIAQVNDRVDFQPHDSRPLVGTVTEVIHDHPWYIPQYIIRAHNKEYRVEESQVSTPN